MLRFKCPNCQKLLGAKEEQAGKRGNCPQCKKPFVVPKPKKVPVSKPTAKADNLAADILAQSEAAEKASQPAKKIEMECPFCFEELKLDMELAGKQAPCPNCKRIIKVERPKEDAPQDWREASRDGPQFTKENVENKLDDAWGTATDRTAVHSGSLQQAGALPERETAPVTVGTWIRRGFIAVGIVAFLVVGYLGASYFSHVSSQKKAVERAKTAFEQAQKKMPRVWMAEYHHLLGEFYASKESPKPALDQFYAARFRFPPGPDKNAKEPSWEEKLLLMEVALSLTQLGGTEDEKIDGKKILWEEMPQALGRIFAAIDSKEAKLFALRRVCLKLLQMNQNAVALSLANQINANSKDDALKGEQVAVLLALKSPDEAKKLLPPPGKKGKLDLGTRIGYAEGRAHEGNFKEARQIAGAPVVAADRALALLGVAEVALHYEHREEAKACLDEAVKVFAGVPKQKHPLIRYHITWLSARLDSPDKAKQWADQIPDSGLKALAQFEILRQKAQADPAALDPSQISAKKSMGFALAVELEARRNPSQIAAMLDSYDEGLQPLIYLVQALK